MKKLRGVVIIVVCVALCVGYYYYLSHRSGTKETQLTEIEQIIQKDLDKNYPSTPREIIKFYNRILTSFFNEECTDAQIKELGNQARKLMDEELLENNPENEYYMDLNTELKAYAIDKQKIANITISTSNEVEYKTVNEAECAYVDASYFVKGKNTSERAVQTYILRKDKEGNWKILGCYMPE